MMSVFVPPAPPLNAIESTNAALRLSPDVINKFDVELVTDTVEELISRKLVEDVHEKEEAFYFIDLGAVMRKYQQWVDNLPRVKPYYGTFKDIFIANILYFSY